jgi:hypothetical protein
MASTKSNGKDTNGFFEYQRKIRTAKLLMKEKSLLWLYASMFDWENQEPSFMGIELIAAWTGMSEASVTRAKKKLKDLGWIKDYRENRYSPVLVWVQAGLPDPEYDYQAFSIHHVYKSTKSKPSIDMADGLDEFDVSRLLSDVSNKPVVGSRFPDSGFRIA